MPAKPTSPGPRPLDTCTMGELGNSKRNLDQGEIDMTYQNRKEEDRPSMMLRRNTSGTVHMLKLEDASESVSESET
jgi:hypothetical protein